MNKFLTSLSLSGFRGKREEFYEQLARSYEMKESFRDFLDAELKTSTTPATADGSRATALKMMKARQQTGDAMKYSQVLGPVMPPSDGLMLAALDDAPDKPALMRKIAHSVIEGRALKGIVKGAVIPPLLVMPGAFSFAFVMATKSIPIIVKVAPPEVWTTFNQAVRSFAEFVAAYSGYLILAVIAAIVFFGYQLPRWTGTWRNKLESVKPATATMLFPVCPILLPLSIYRDVQAGLMFSALAVMLQSGRTLTDALSTIQRNAQPWMRWHVRRILAHLETSPTEYRQAFSKGLISPQLLARLSSQIRTNPRFDDVLIKLGEKGGEEIRIVVKKQTAVINAMLLGAAGGMVLFMMLGQLSISNSLTTEMSPAKQMQRRLEKQQAEQAQ